ncbi:type II toxin-antitoxin system prevent-host-death family antitoxin [bacterium]|nr:type II toxin-antitoxin system prevent-host-death family antitoxin [bacterium]MCI0604922.1 type II toxin-antitoxin system prevent-host-death family antitoxin [bacterium]
MANETTYTKARANFAALCDDVASGRQAIIIRRRGAEDVALISASELSSIRETAHLLRSPRNAERLLKSLLRAKSGKGKARTIAQLRKELKIDEKS